MANKKKKKDSKKGGGGKGKNGAGSNFSSKSNSSQECSGFSSSNSSSSVSNSASSPDLKPPSIPVLSSEADQYMNSLVRDYLVRQSIPLSVLVQRCFRLRALHPPPESWWDDLDPMLPAELRDGFLLCSLAGLTRAYLEPLAAQTMAAIRAELEHRQLFVVLSSFTNYAYDRVQYAAVLAGILDTTDQEGSLPRVYLLKTAPISGLKTKTEVTDTAVNMFFSAMKLVWPEDKNRWLYQVRLVIHSVPFAPTAKVLATVNPTRLLTIPSLEGAIARIEDTLRLLLQPRLHVTQYLLTPGGPSKDQSAASQLLNVSRDYFGRFGNMAVIHGVQMFIDLFTAEEFVRVSGIRAPLPPKDAPNPEDPNPSPNGPMEVLALVEWMAYVEEHYEALGRFFERQEYRFGKGLADYGFSSREHWTDFQQRFGRPLAAIRQALKEGGMIRRRAVDVLALVERFAADLSNRATVYERELGRQLKEWLDGAVGLQKLMGILRGPDSKDPKIQELKTLLKYAPLQALTVEQCYPSFASRILRGAGNLEIREPEVMEAHAVVICAQESWRRRVVVPFPVKKPEEPKNEEVMETPSPPNENGNVSKNKKKKNRKKNKNKKEQQLC